MITWDEIKLINPKDLTASQALNLLIKINGALIKGELVLTPEQEKEWDFIDYQLFELANELVPDDD